MLMATRAALGELAWWEISPAVAVMVPATYGLLRLGGRVCLGGMLQTGQSIRLRDAWKLARG
jgi:ABC-2 type transport system permease protein